MAREGFVAGDELDVFAAAAEGAFHDDLSVAPEGALGGGGVVVGFAMREAGEGAVGVFGGGGRGDGVEGVDVVGFETLAG